MNPLQSAGLVQAPGTDFSREALTVPDRPHPASPDEAHRLLRDGFHRATHGRPELLRESEYVFAGARLRLQVVGPRLAKVYERALAHLRVDDTQLAADLHIRVWHEQEAGIRVPGLTPLTDPRAKGELVASPSGARLRLRRSHSLTSFDRDSGVVFGWIYDLDRLGIYEMGRPFNSELLLWSRERGLQALHAGLVSFEGRGALITGPSGSGKSTTTLSCLLSGLSFLSDDYLALSDEGAGRYTGHSLFASAFVVSDHLRTFPSLARIAVPARYADEEKSMIPLSRLSAGPLSSSARLSAIILPRVTGRDMPAARRASPAEALLRMGPSSMLMLRRAGVDEGLNRQADLESLSRLVASVPAYWLELGGGVNQIPHVIHDILKGTQ
jgi:hypothetical protein